MTSFTYRQQLELLIRIAPIVFSSGTLALKGGTGINLFVQNMPRVSVDLDCVFLDKTLKREAALCSIRQELIRITREVETQGYRASIGITQEDVKCIVSSNRTQVKIEVNPIFRGSLLPVQKMPLCAKASDEFFAEYELPVLCRDELYAGKILAALDRQHPRDFFDVREMLRTGGLTETMIECVVVYLCAHNRPFHEVLFSPSKDQEQLYKTAFAGMTEQPCAWQEICPIRDQLLEELLPRLGSRRLAFIKSFALAEPQWNLCRIKGIDELPAIQWKLKNLEHLKMTNKAKFDEQKNVLFSHIDSLQTAVSDSPMK